MKTNNNIETYSRSDAEEMMARIFGDKRNLMFFESKTKTHILDYLVLEKFFKDKKSLPEEVSDYTFFVSPLCLAFEGFIFKLLKDMGFNVNVEKHKLGYVLSDDEIDKHFSKNQYGEKNIRMLLVKLKIDWKNHRNSLLHFGGDSNLKNIDQATSKGRSILSDMCEHLNHAYKFSLIDVNKGDVVDLNTEVSKSLIYKTLSSEIDEKIENKHVTISDILGTSRKQEVISERRRIVVFLRDDRGMTFSSIADVLNKKDHTTIMNLYKKGKKL